MKPATCALCGAAEAYPMFGHVTPLCRTCDREWQESPERQAAARARQDFIERKRGERGGAVVVELAPARPPADKDWGAA